MAATAPKPMARPVGFLVEQYWGRGIFFCTRCSLLSRFVFTGKHVASADFFRLQLQGFLTVKKSISSSYSCSISSFKRTIELKLLLPCVTRYWRSCSWNHVWLNLSGILWNEKVLSLPFGHNQLRLERFLLFSPNFSFCETRHCWQADTDRGCSVFRCQYKYKYKYKIQIQMEIQI